MKRKWDSLPLMPEIRATLDQLGFKQMTPVQAAVIPLMLQKKDVAADAVTGSGKTLAFVIPMLEMLSKVCLGKHDIGAVIISPTRELAYQIGEVIATFLRSMPQFTLQVFIGGKASSVNNDMAKFRNEGGHIIVATPGRLEDILLGKTLGHREANVAHGLKCLELLVLDEADRLLSLGFEKAVNTILQFLPKQRRTGLFSATQTKEVTDLIRAGLRNPVLVAVKEKDDDDDGNDNDTQASSKQVVPVALNNYFIVCEPVRKFDMLVRFLRQHTEKTMLFFTTGACVEYFSLLLHRLLKSSRPVQAIHGKKAKRQSILDTFRKSSNGILVCTDVMARGIDIPDVRWVLQFDPPSNVEAFIHRCGRTARNGAAGSAVLFLLPTEEVYIDFIRINQQVQLQPFDEAWSEELPRLLKEIRTWQKNDRSIFDLAQRAFVSFVQAYSKHECKWVLRLKDLDLGSMATAFSLLMLPKMPELRQRDLSQFVADGVDLNEISYKDKQKEKVRMNKLEVFRQSGKWPGQRERAGGVETSWSKKKEQKAKKTERKRKKELKQQESQLLEQQDLDEIEQDFRLLKRIKKGKSSQADFDERIELENMTEET